MLSDLALQRIIFGLNVKQRRSQLGLSFAELSERTNIAISYLNEIEKGKKFPKQKKMSDLAKGLDTDPASLSEISLPEKLKPLSFLLESNFLKEIPFDLFGIEIGKIVEIVSNAPIKVAAFLSAIVELSRNYAVGERHFYLIAMRAYQELHDNSFPEIDEIAIRLRKKHFGKKVHLEVSDLVDVLYKEYGVKTNLNSLADEEDLDSLRSLYLPRKKLLKLNKKLQKDQQLHQLAKEIGFHALQKKNRPYSNSLLEISSFEEVLTNFQAGYFSVSFLIEVDSFEKTVDELAALNEWNPGRINELFNSFNVSPETLCRRLNFILQKRSIKNVFFMRFSMGDGLNVKMDKELHLNRKNNIYARVGETYCKRWSGIYAVEKIEPTEGVTVSTQISRYYNTDTRYFVFSIVKPPCKVRPKPISISFGILIDEASTSYFKFLNDKNIPEKVVNHTCERCELNTCEERGAAAIHIQKKQQRKSILNAINQAIAEK